MVAGGTVTLPHNGWRREFEDPIELPDGRELVTLHDTAQYMFGLPKRTIETASWQLAMRCLIDSADQIEAAFGCWRGLRSCGC